MIKKETQSLISKKHTNLKEPSKLIRRYEVLLHQLKVGECRLVGKFRERIALVGSGHILTQRYCARME